MIRKCNFCGKEYETEFYWWRFCSDECYQAFIEEKNSRLIKCEICGKEFHPTSSRAKYCSNECRKTARDRQIKQWQKDHREQINEKQRKWRKDHPEQVKEYNCQNYQKHKEKRRKNAREKSKQYYLLNKETILANRRAHRKEINEADRNRRLNKKIEACRAKHNNCFSCSTLDGECLFD